MTRLGDMTQAAWDEEMSFLLDERWEDRSIRQAKGCGRVHGADFDITVTHSTLRGRKVHAEVPRYLRNRA